jgi:hypothetical protein
MIRLVQLQWTHPQRGEVTEILCPHHERNVLHALKTLDLGCAGSWAPKDSGPCQRCASGGLLPPRMTAAELVGPPPERKA